MTTMSTDVRSAAPGCHLSTGRTAIATTIRPIARSCRLRAASTESTPGASTVRSKRALLSPQLTSAAVRAHQANRAAPVPRSAARAAKTAPMKEIEPRASSTTAETCWEDVVNSTPNRSLEVSTTRAVDPVMSAMRESPSLARGP